MDVSTLRAEADRLYKVPIDQGRELESVAQLLLAQPRKGFIEIGAGGGGSFHVWSRCIPEGPKISLDWYDVSSEDKVEQWWGKKNLREHREVLWRKHFTQVWPLFVPSAERLISRLVDGILQGKQVDFLFIDGRWQDVEYNFETYSRFVRPGGLVGVHCIHQDRPDAAGLRAYWAKLASRYPTKEFAYGPHKSGRMVGGTGVVFV